MANLAIVCGEPLPVKKGAFDYNYQNCMIRVEYEPVTGDHILSTIMIQNEIRE